MRAAKHGACVQGTIDDGSPEITGTEPSNPSRSGSASRMGRPTPSIHAKAGSGRSNAAVISGAAPAVFRVSFTCTPSNSWRTKLPSARRHSLVRQERLLIKDQVGPAREFGAARIGGRGHAPQRLVAM